jgi:beta-lactamase class A
MMLAPLCAAALLASAMPAVGAVAGAQGQPTDSLSSVARAELAQKFQRQLMRIASEVDGVLTLTVMDLTNGERFRVNDTVPMPQGSAIKIPILIELFRQAEAGTVSLDTRVALTAADQVGGTGVAQYFSAGQSQLSLRDLATLMIVLSDNTATNVLIGRLGMEQVTATMRRMGLPGIRLQRLMIRPNASAAGRENIATAAQAASLMQQLYRCTLPVSAASCAEIRRILEIPKDGEFPSSVPSSVRVAWKPGTVDGVATSWGLFALAGRPYVVTAMVSYSTEAQASKALRDVADAAYAYFFRLARASAYGVRVPAAFADSLRVPASMASPATPSVTPPATPSAVPPRRPPSL